MGDLNSFSASGGGIWTKIYQKFKFPGGMFKLRFDWYITLGLCLTTLQANCFWSMRVPLVNWKCEVIPCQNVEEYFWSFESRWRGERRKKPESVIQRRTRRTGRGSSWRNGKLAGGGYSMVMMGEGMVGGGETFGRVKTNPGECILRVTRLNGEYS